MTINFSETLAAPKEREYNLYLANYCAHRAKRSLEKLTVEEKENLKPDILEKLVGILNQFAILDDVEHPKNA